MPLSSAHCVTGSTTSASAAVSLITMSATTSRSRSASRDATWVALGADTTMLLPKTSSAFGPPSVPRASSSSYAERPLPGSVSGSTPQTAATCDRAAGSSIIR